LDATVSLLPFEHYTKPTDQFDPVAFAGSLFMFIALMFNFAVFFYSIVNEKDLKLRLAMRLVGLSDVAYWLSWYAISVLWLVYGSWAMIGVGAACGLRKFRFVCSSICFILFFWYSISVLWLVYGS
jgi:hypothetical protein